MENKRIDCMTNCACVYVFEEYADLEQPFSSQAWLMLRHAWPSAPIPTSTRNPNGAQYSMGPGASRTMRRIIYTPRQMVQVDWAHDKHNEEKLADEKK